MDFKEYAAGVEATWSVSDRALSQWEKEVLACETGLSGESGEISELIKKGIFHQVPGKLDREIVKKELGDLLYYLTKMGDLFGITLEQIAVANNEKLKARYPNGFVFGGGIREAE